MFELYALGAKKLRSKNTFLSEDKHCTQFPLDSLSFFTLMEEDIRSIEDLDFRMIHYMLINSGSLILGLQMKR